MKYIYISLFILLGCSTDRSDFKIIKEATLMLDVENHKNIIHLQKVSAEEGFKNQKLVDGLFQLISFRTENKNSEKVLIEYSDKLKLEFNKDIFLDTSKLKNLNNAIFNYSHKNDSFNYYNLKLKLILLEKEIIKMKGTQMGSSSWYMARVSKSKDTVLINNEITLAVYSEMEEVKIKDEVLVQIFLNGKLLKMPIRIETIGSVAIVRFTPYLVGDYLVKGNIFIQNRHDNEFISYGFIDHVIVE